MIIYFKILISCFISLILITEVGCHSKKKAKEVEIPIQQTTSDRICFVVLKISKDSFSGNNNITLINKIESEGTMKNTGSFTNGAGYYLTAEVSGTEGISATYTIDHPLYKHFEYTDENNNFKVKDTIAGSAEFFIRMQLNSNSKLIKISELIKDQPKKELTEIKL
ncbi:MAG: hypothetical protein H7321_05515 [Bacteroidia bacterium]|nr:hypothetical protein [Bacteroidia bacterium]